MILEKGMCDFDLVKSGHKIKIESSVSGSKLSYLQSNILAKLLNGFDEKLDIYEIAEEVWGYSLAHDMRPFYVHLSKIRMFLRETDPNYVLLIDGSVIRLSHHTPMDKLESAKKAVLTLLKMKPAKLITDADLELINLLKE